MRADILPGGAFPDYELTDHTKARRRLSELQGIDPMILVLSRGGFCPKDHQQHLELAANYPKIRVAFTERTVVPLPRHQEEPAMEYLVTMTTHVPAGTPDRAVDDIRAREAAHSRELAAAGHLLRLWRPPLQPGEWRSLGLFAAADGGQLEEVLATMPLRVWRTDEVTPLAPHPNDPALAARNAGTEFLTIFTISVPEGTPGQAVDDTEAREARRAKELAGQGHLLRLWRLPGPSRALGLWNAGNPAEMQAILKSLPLDPWMTVETTPLSRHPSDPAMIIP